jgi:ADP-ribose pyrophosphatase YjhB (NUDIX family)
MVERDESLETALDRESREETGVEAAVEEPFFIRRGK